VVEQEGTDNLVVLLGTPTAESSKLYAITVTEGDPSWAGPLAGVALKLPVYHIIEPEVKTQIDPKVYEAEVGVAEMVLESDAIIQALREVRNGGGMG